MWWTGRSLARPVWFKSPLCLLIKHLLLRFHMKCLTVCIKHNPSHLLLRSRWHISLNCCIFLGNPCPYTHGTRGYFLPLICLPLMGRLDQPEETRRAEEKLFFLPTTSTWVWKSTAGTALLACWCSHYYPSQWSSPLFSNELVTSAGDVSSGRNAREIFWGEGYLEWHKSRCSAVKQEGFGSKR